MDRLAAVANGDEEDANASNPVRLSPCCSLAGVAVEVDDVPKAVDGKDVAPTRGFGLTIVEVFGVGVPEDGGGVANEPEVDGLSWPHVLDAKRLGPRTDENGEFDDAYDAKPDCDIGITSVMTITNFSGALTGLTVDTEDVDENEEN